MFDYMKVVDPIAVRREAVRIVAPLANEHPWNWHQAAAIFDHVRRSVRYVLDPRGIDYVAPPRETLECGGGDCDDQAVLVASLCEAVGIPTRIVFCTGQHERHVLCQIDFGDSNPDRVCRDLVDYYAGTGIDVSAGFDWEIGNDGSMLLFADTAMGRYLGDARLLFDRGYIDVVNGGKDWVWRFPTTVFRR